MTETLKGMRIAILATDMVEEVELVEPRQALEDVGATTELIAPKEGEIQSANHFDKGEKYQVDATLEEVEPTDYDAVYLPGGALNADNLRVEPLAQRFIQAMVSTGKAVAVICHGAWLLVSSGVVDGKQMTSYHTIADDIRNAHGEWVDEPVVIDELLVSSRQPDDIPAFNKAMVGLFAETNPQAV